MTAKNGISVKFWGVRGSIPAPIMPAAVEAKVIQAVTRALQDKNATAENACQWVRDNLPFTCRSTYGGNTTCLEVRCDDCLIILDMGSGLRELGISLLRETLANKGLRGTILQSHVHWDHIQGYPFWKQLYMPNGMFANKFDFYGGRDWDKSLVEVLRGQMNPPVFPVDHRELELIGLRMHFNSVWTGRQIEIPGPDSDSPIKVTCRKLHHPQETYGYRIEFRGQVLTFCTDHEPYCAPDRNLLALAEGADIFITDCQYTFDEYRGHGGRVQKIGWGHSYPEYIAEVVREAKPRLVVTTHHEPEADDVAIEKIAQTVERLSSVRTLPAWEGLVLNCADVG